MEREGAMWTGESQSLPHSCTGAELSSRILNYSDLCLGITGFSMLKVLFQASGVTADIKNWFEDFGLLIRQPQKNPGTMEFLIIQVVSSR